MRIFVVESDAALGTFLKRGFEADNYSIDLAEVPDEAKRMVEGGEYDAAILDVNVRDATVLDVLRDVRAARPHLPILILTSRTRAEDRAQMLDLGADDIMIKPFALSELSARVRALLRRGTRLPETVLRIDDLELNLVEHKGKRAGRILDLTPKEFSLLEYLMRNAERPVTRTEIIEHVWNLSFDTTYSSILTALPSAAPFTISITVLCPVDTSSSATPNRFTASAMSFAWCISPGPPPITGHIPISRRRRVREHNC